MLITFCPGRGSNQGLLRANPTLYCVAVKAGLYRKAIQVCIIPSTTTVLPTLLYACETWTVYQRHAKRLNHFHLSCLRKLLKIKWQDKIPDTEVLKKAGMQSMHTVLKLAQLRWTGHVIRMPDERLPKKVFYFRTTRGKALSRWPEETLQRHPESLSEGF